MESDIQDVIKRRKIDIIRKFGKEASELRDLFLDEDTGNLITPLHLAVRLEFSDVVDALINAGVPFEEKSTCGKLPIEELQFRSDEADAICALLLDRPRSELPSSVVLYELVLRAVKELRPRSVELLIQKGAPVLETSKIIGHFRSYVTTPLFLWAGMELDAVDTSKMALHEEIGSILLRIQKPRSAAVHKALFRTIAVGNKPATEAIIRHGVDLVRDSKVNLFERDALVSAIAGHYSVGKRDQFIRLILDSGYRVTEDIQEHWVKNVLPSILICPGMSCSTARLIFSVIGKVSRNTEIWKELVDYAENEGPEVDLIPEISNGLQLLRDLDSMCLVNICRDSLRSATIRNTTNTAEWINKVTIGFPPVVQRFLLLEDIFPGA